MDEAEIIRKRIQVYGQVQGVGFRYLARQAAGYLDLTGWIRNEYDGSVLMELQGRKSDVDRLLPTVQDGRWIRISHVDEEILEVKPDERSFQVLF